MTQQPRFGLNKEARLAAERKEQAVPTAQLELDPRFPYALLPNPFAGMEGVESSSPAPADS